MHVSTADVGDTGWLQEENVERNIATEPLKSCALEMLTLLFSGPEC